LDQYKVGEQVNVSLNIRGRSWTNPQGETKYFNTLEAWRLERLDGNGDSIQDKAPTTPVHEEESDLPF
jgi:hypothetical protein